ncbi:LpqB family beta-propeller domain-containing protein [Micromonospora humida]|uniref:GerMN domain-containing protein n=1 Tax=Micromonospora humida TaxID=2809018 RepID=A0ABS2J3W9_9ACTN|nr:LpqB family beta-propeller domain-containing protein [Micromonospora humida]MBM7080479.1 GerMN domain-containing protein [Micromonospora humida]
MNRPRALAGLLCAALLAAVAGCGIPDRTDVQVDGSGPAASAGSSSFARGEPPTRTASGADREAFVRNFLAAAAGEPERAYARVKQFIAREDRNRLAEKQGSEVAINVVRLIENPVITENASGLLTVRVPVQQVGVLRANGVLGPPVVTDTEYQFSLRGSAEPGQEGTEAGGYYVTDPPSVLLLDTLSLRDYYQTRTVYFWNSDATRLVADQRYLPLAVPAERLVSEAVKWLIAGPSEWLRQGVSGLPDRTALINNAVKTDGRWEVNLDLPGDDRRKLEKLGIQLAWSLSDLDGPLQLTTRNQSRVTIDDLAAHRLANAVYPLTQGPQRFTVYAGAIHPLAFEAEAIGTVPIRTEDNHDVVSAAVRRTAEKTLAALVTTAGGGRQRLVTGSGVAPVQVMTPGAQTFAAIGRPVWLRPLGAAQPYGLVVADGRLYRFDDRARMVPVPVGVAGPVSAVAASLDGHRIALIVGGRLCLSTASLDGGVVSLGPVRHVATTLTDLSAVDWAQENALAVAGSTNRSAVYEVGVDGVQQTPLVTDVGARVTHLAVYPGNPTYVLPTVMMMYEANGVSYRFRASSAETIRGEQVLDVPPPPAGGRAGSPTAPFFLF